MAQPSARQLRFAVVAVDAVCFRVVAGRLMVLLSAVNVAPHYKNRWGLVGGLIRSNETADEAAERHLADKAGIDRIYKEQLYAFSEVKRDPRGRVISVAYLCLGGDHLEARAGAIETRWCAVADAPKLAYDHDAILRTALERLRARLGYTTVAQHLLPREFTLTELQSVYEAVLGKELDKRNFRKKVLAIGILSETGKKRAQGASRPAALYKFSSSKVSIIEIL